MGIGLDVESTELFMAAATLPKALLSEPEFKLLLLPEEPVFVLTLPVIVVALDTDVESEFRLEPPSWLWFLPAAAAKEVAAYWLLGS